MTITNDCTIRGELKPLFADNFDTKYKTTDTNTECYAVLLANYM